MQTTISYQSNKKPIPSDVFTPEGTANGGLIILAHGSDGLVDNSNGHWKSMIEGYAIDLAARGFVAAIPNYFASTGTVPGQLDPSNPSEYAKQIVLHRNAWQKTLQDGVFELVKPEKVPGIDKSRVGLIGFSLGGHLCARLAPVVKALVVFFAPYMDGLGLNSTLSLHAEIHHGEKDFLPYKANAEAIRDELKENKANSKLWDPYPGAVHGFVGSDSDNTNARMESRKRTMSFFETSL